MSASLPPDVKLRAPPTNIAGGFTVPDASRWLITLPSRWRRSKRLAAVPPRRRRPWTRLVRLSNEPDALYDLSCAYRQLGFEATADDVLQQVLRLNPAHPQAGSDLACEWAEQGKNLAAAEQLTRHAVEATPGSAVLLDSLGWVLYKEGRFEEARAALEQAIGPEPSPPTAMEPLDPVLLDHFGDCLYRLHEADAAGRFWQRCSSRLAGISGEGKPCENPSNLRSLRSRLESKQQQLKAGQPVDVAPVANAR